MESLQDLLAAFSSNKLEALRSAAPDGMYKALGVAALCLIATWGLTLLWRECYGPAGPNRPPGPWFVLPFLGETVQLLKVGPLEFFLARMRKYGPVFRTHLLGENIYVVGDFQAVRALLREYSVEMHAPGSTFKHIIHDSSHVRDEHMHVPWRRYILAALRPAAVEALYPALQRCVERTLDEWGSRKRVPLVHECSVLAMDMACDGATGITFESQRTRDWAQGLFYTVNKGLYGLPINLPGTDLYAALAARDKLQVGLRDDLMKDVERIKLAFESAEDPSKVEAQNMLEAQVYSLLPAKTLSYDKVFDRTIGSIVAAGDTTKTILIAVLVLVAGVPRVYERLREEQRQMMRRDGSTAPAWKAVSALPFLDATVKEAMRLLPAATGGFRMATKALPVLGYVIPAGAKLWWSVHLMHALEPSIVEATSAAHSGGNNGSGPAGTAPEPGSAAAARQVVGQSGVPAHMDAFTASPAALASAFRPERWLSAEEGSDAAADDGGRPRQYMTFGGGLHLCPGMNLSYMEAKLMMVHMLRRFHWRMSDPLFLSKVRRFPGILPEAGTDWLELEERPLTL